MARTLDDTLREIRAAAGRYLEKDRSGRGYVCPVCGSGSGNKGTGIAMKEDREHFTCFAGGCFSNADLLDIIGAQYSLSEFWDKVNKACEVLHIQKPDSQWQGQRNTKGQAPAAQPAKAQGQRQESGSNNTNTITQTQLHNSGNTIEKVFVADEEPLTDYSLYYEQCAANLEKTNYHRGLSLVTLRRFNVGFDPAWKHPKHENDQNKKPSPRLIVPIDAYHYLARRTDGWEIFSKPTIGLNAPPFNMSIVGKEFLPIFVVEGAIDAMSIVEIGLPAIAIGGTSGVNRLLEYVKSHRPEKGFIIAMDNDGPGQKAAEKLRAGLTAARIPFVVPSQETMYGKAKDANECLNQDRAGFQQRLGDIAGETAAEVEMQISAERENLQHESALYCIPSFMEALANDAVPCVPTGIESLDKCLDGGFYPGLYGLGAVTALGKTTFAIQLLDNVAKQGHKVMAFSLEMSRHELMAKSLSRLTYLHCNKIAAPIDFAKSTRDLLSGRRFRYFNQTSMEVFNKAIEEYKTYAANIFIHEGIGDIDSKFVRNKISEFARLTGAPPKLVLIDYLQILAPEDTKMTDKQNVDKSILELKRISRDFNITILVISSFNRQSYAAPVSLASFKESGAVEYSTDVLIGLQLYGMDTVKGEGKEAQKQANEIVEKALKAVKENKPEAVQLKILKNRNGVKGDCVLDFMPRYNCYLPWSKDLEDSEFDDAEETKAEPPLPQQGQLMEWVIKDTEEEAF